MVTPIHEEILLNPSRFKVICAGRRWGKTTLALIYLLQGELRAEQRRWFIAPTYRQGKMIAWRTLKSIFRGDSTVRINESELSIVLSNGAEISIKGGDNESSLRGAGLSRCVLDEFASMKPDIWSEIIRPMLATERGGALFIGTPSGYNQFYDLYCKGRDGEKDWKSWQFTTAQSEFVSIEEVESARSDMDARLYAQEFEATFQTTGNRAAYNFDREKHLKVAEQLSQEHFIGIDFNVSMLVACVGCVYSDDTIHFYDEIVLRDTNTEAMALTLRNKFRTVTHIYPDPAGKARSTTSSRSDHQILRDHGFVVHARSAHPTHRDRINSLNRKLQDANGKVGMTVDPKCKVLINDLEKVMRDSKTGGIDKSSDMKLTHAFDACSYFIEYRWSAAKRSAFSVDR